MIFTYSIHTGKDIQFYIKALDRVESHGPEDLTYPINHFLIDLELELGAAFTERTTYTGIYNISGLGFDMSFRVQCSENYYGPNCTIFCESVQNLYITCGSGGSRICLQSGQDPATDCATCITEMDPETNCTTCLSSSYDPHTNCTQCLTGRDVSTNCTECLPGYDPSTDCTECLTGRDVSTNCTTCLPGYDPSTNCNENLPNIQYQSTQTTTATSST